jgi:hypothetical protein
MPKPWEKSTSGKRPLAAGAFSIAVVRSVRHDSTTAGALLSFFTASSTAPSGMYSERVPPVAAVGYQSCTSSVRAPLVNRASARERSTNGASIRVPTRYFPVGSGKA